MKIRRLFGMILASLLLFSCSLSQEDSLVARTLELPDLRLTNAVYVNKGSDGNPVTVYAQEISIYEATNKAFITGFSFVQKNDAGDIEITGKADQAEVDTNTYDAELKGNIRVEKPAENLIIEADNLSWKAEDQLLSSEGDAIVRLNYQDNKVVTGQGFHGDLKHSEFEFSKLLEGVVK